MLARRIHPVFKPALTESLRTCQGGDVSIFYLVIALLFLESLLLHSLHSLAYSGNLNDTFGKSIDRIGLFKA